MSLQSANVVLQFLGVRDLAPNYPLGVVDRIGAGLASVVLMGAKF